MRWANGILIKAANREAPWRCLISLLLRSRKWKATGIGATAARHEWANCSVLSVWFYKRWNPRVTALLSAQHQCLCLLYIDNSLMMSVSSALKKPGSKTSVSCCFNWFDCSHSFFVSLHRSGKRSLLPQLCTRLWQWLWQVYSDNGSK